MPFIGRRIDAMVPVGGRNHLHLIAIIAWSISNCMYQEWYDKSSVLATTLK